MQFDKQRRFRRPGNLGRSNPGLVTRQAQAATMAAGALGGVAEARAFLNSPNAALGGRPIDVAGASAEGLSLVADAIGAARDGIAPAGA